MAVRFLLGPAGSGKTHYCLAELRKLEREGRRAIYLVPEQFTYSADRALLTDTSLRGLRHVQVLSFTRLAYRLREAEGVAGPPAVTDAVRSMLLRAILARMEPSVLGGMAALRRRQGLLQELGRFVGEVRAYGPVSFHEVVHRVAGDPALPSSARDRLGSLAAVFEAYSSALRDLGRVDPEEALAGLEALVAVRPEIPASRVLVDEFLSWTRREREILVSLARAGARLEIALGLEPAGGPHFAAARRSLETLRAAFARAEIDEEPPLLFPPAAPRRGRFQAAVLGRLERGLFADHAGAPGERGTEVAPAGDIASGPAILLQPARSRRHEVLCWARTIDRWLRLDPKPCPPQEIAIIVRDLAPYRDFLREVFARYQIPLFLDERRGFLAHPRARFLLEALEVLLSGWRRDAVITFLRNPLLDVPPAEVDLLEILSREYGKDFEAWYAPAWDGYEPGRRARFALAAEDGPEEEEEIEAEEGEEIRRALDELAAAGLTAAGAPAAGLPADGSRAGGSPATRPPGGANGTAEPEDARRASIRRADELRASRLFPLREMEERWASAPPTGRRLAADLRALQAALAAAPPGPEAEPEWTPQVEKAIERLLDEAARLWEELEVEPSEFARVLRQGLASERVGVVPHKIGQVTAAEIQRSRLFGIRRAIVGGLNDGVFPRAPSDDPLLPQRDRESLLRCGMELGPSAAERQEEEAYLTYIALTRASERLVCTWSRMDEVGAALEPSLLVEEIRRAVPGCVEEPVALEPEGLPVGSLQTGIELGDRLVLSLAQELDAASRAAAEGVPEGAPADAREDAPEGAPADAREDAPEAAAEAARKDAPEDAPENAPEGAPEDAPVGGREDGARSVAVPSDAELLAELYARVCSESPGAPAAGPLAVARARLERARPLLLWVPETELVAEVLERAFPGGAVRTGVSRLLEFARCPFQAFARRLLRLEPKPLAAVTPLETGTLAHAALERFFDAPSAPDPRAIRRRLRDVFAELEQREEFRAFFLDEASRYRWGSTLRNLEQYLRVEMRRLAGSPYAPQGQEVAFGPAWGNEVEIALPGRGVLELSGRIDRLDARTEGQTTYGTVLDYKRSGRTGLPATLERGLDLQLAAYLLFVRDRLGWQPAGGFYAPVLIPPVRAESVRSDEENPLRIKVHGIFRREEGERLDGGTGMLVGERGPSKQALDRDALDALLETGRRHLATYAHGLRSGWIAARPLEEKPGVTPCPNCEFAAACRFRERRDPLRRDPHEGMAPLEEPGACSGSGPGSPSGGAP